MGVSRGRGPLLDPHVFPQVEILEGKDAGKQGKVVQVIRQRNWVVLEGLNTVSGERMGCSGSPSHVTLREEQPGKEGRETSCKGGGQPTVLLFTGAEC